MDLSLSIAYRTAQLADVDAMARIRAADWGSFEYWQGRIRGYMTGELNPRDALPSRTALVALQNAGVVGFAAGHLTRRRGCTAELQWINVDIGHRRGGVATQLLERLAHWFVAQEATRVCVDADEDVRDFYLRRGAEPLDHHWLVWNDITHLARSTHGLQGRGSES